MEFAGGTPHLKKQYQSEKAVMEPLPSETSVSIIYKTGRAATGGDSSAGAGWRYARVASSTATTFSTLNATEAEFIINDTGKVFEIGAELTPSGSDTPEVTALVGYISDKTLEH